MKKIFLSLIVCSFFVTAFAETKVYLENGADVKVQKTYVDKKGKPVTGTIETELKNGAREYMELSVVDGIKNGRYRIPFEDCGEETGYYKDGVLDGEMLINGCDYHEKYTYKNGVLEGEHLYSEGGCTEKVSYKNGKMHGKFIYECGDVVYNEDMYQDGELNGIFRRYYYEGEIKLKGMFRNGVLDGNVHVYGESGDEAAIIVYENGEPVKVRCYGETYDASEVLYEGFDVFNIYSDEDAYICAAG